jgi:trypsin
VFLGLALIALGGIVRPAAAIMGGAPAPTGSWPFAVYVQLTTSTGTESCSGSLVATNVVLTAGHCVTDSATNTVVPASDIRVTTGRVDRNDASSGQVQGVAQVAVYPGFALGIDRGDVALLQLVAPSTATVIPLAGTTDAGWASSTGRGLQVAGWGRTDPASAAHPSVLAVVSLAVQSDASCASALSRTYPTSFDATTMFCAAGATPTLGACRGDSGGPVVAVSPAGVATQVGVVSWSRANCVHPDVFARVSALAPWLQAELAALQVAPPAPVAPVVVPVIVLPPPPVIKPLSVPTIRAGASSGKPGGYARLRFWAHNHAQRMQVQAQVYDGARLVWSRTTGTFEPVPGVDIVSWRVPRTRKRPLTFCVQGLSPAGTRSAKVCAPLTIRSA